SVVGAGGDPPQSAYNSGPPSWQNISKSTYNGMITDGNYGNNVNTGVKQLTLPFVTGASLTNPTNSPTAYQTFEIIRQPPAGEAASSAIGQSRFYNEAQIRRTSDSPTASTTVVPTTARVFQPGFRLHCPLWLRAVVIPLTSQKGLRPFRIQRRGT